MPREYVLWVVALGVLALLAPSARAIAQDSDQAALALADRADVQAQAPRPCTELAEGTAGATTLGDGRAPLDGGRASYDLRCDDSPGAHWSAALSDRLDYLWGRGGSAETINTLKEAYLTWRAAPDQLFDLGRINVREGVGLAYDPTDYFRADAIRTFLSPDPQTLRTERLGSAMLRSQTLWSTGSLTAIYSPHLASHPSGSSLNPDFGASNSRNRWLLLLSQRIGDGLQPQWLLTGADGESPQAGLDLTALPTAATVVYVEWSGGRSADNLARSGAEPTVRAADAFHSRLSTGITYTTSFNLSLSLEYEYDGAAPDGRQWAALRSMPGPFVQYREYVAGQQDLATRQNVFAYAHWDGIGLQRLELTLLARVDPYDHSRLEWGEVRYDWRRTGLAVQWQRNDGPAASDFSLWPARQSWLAVIDYYL
ncbi:MAG: hypothetical protein ACREUG_01045 [Steroidobacteraceae bacterium]